MTTTTDNLNNVPTPAGGAYDAKGWTSTSHYWRIS
jgi:hypothetical protein